MICLLELEMLLWMGENVIKENYEMIIPMKCSDYKECGTYLLFMGFRKRLLPEDCLFAFQKINGVRTINELIKVGCKLDAIEELYHKNIIIFKRVRKEINAKLEKVLMVSPHMDDIALSASGYMSRFCYDKEFDLLVIFGRQDYTLYQKFVNGQKYLLEEEKTFWRYMDIRKGDILHFQDAPLRECYDIKTAIGSSLSASEIILKEKNLYLEIQQMIDLALGKEEYRMVILPMGIGNHVDHILVREAGINCCIKNKVDALFFQDFPYVLSYPNDVGWVDKEGIQYSEERVNISKYIAIKRDAIKIYRSQLFDKQIEKIVNYALYDGQYYEYYVKGTVTERNV